MQTKFLSFGKSAFAGAAAALALLVAGCGTTITDMTSPIVGENPSQIYTVTTRVKPQSANLVPNSLSVKIVIDGQIFPMSKSSLGDDIYEYEYTMPAGRSEAAYYVLVNYRTVNNGVSYLQEEYTPIKRIKLLNRYVFTLDAVRGPVGARIAVVGRGFTPQDVIYLDGTPARTVFESPNAIAFHVPAVPAGKAYTVMLNSASGSQPIGTFRVDGVSLAVTPSALTLRSGETTTILFSLTSPAPVGGLLVQVETNVPKSVVMPEVIIPEGALSAQVTVKGGQPGSGNIYISSASGEITLPITVTAR